MPLWRIEPAADAADSRWLDHDIWTQVIVRAGSAARARAVAAAMERAALRSHARPGNESLAFKSAFEDEKLYWVSSIDADARSDWSEDGPEAVLRQVRGPTDAGARPG